MSNDLSRKAADCFRFKQFTIHHDQCAMKVGTDGVLLGAWAPVDDAQKMLDIGTGSGVIAIMLAQRQPNAQVHAVEIDEKACQQASRNMEECVWSSALSVHETSIQDYASRTDELYDLIVSNPPFFSGGVFSANQDRTMVRHTVKLPHGDLLRSVRALLAPEGKFCVILPFIEGLRFVEMAGHYNIHCTRITEVVPVKNKPANRVLLQFEHQAKELVKDRLSIREKPDEFTTEYKAMTSAFYLKF